jgi:hypothetical protein
LINLTSSTCNFNFDVKKLLKQRRVINFLITNSSEVHIGRSKEKGVCCFQSERHDKDCSLKIVVDPHHLCTASPQDQTALLLWKTLDGSGSYPPTHNISYLLNQRRWTRLKLVVIYKYDTVKS